MVLQVHKVSARIETERQTVLYLDSAQLNSAQLNPAQLISAQFIATGVNRFYRAKRSVARYSHDKLSVCPSVRLSLTLVDCDHMRWNSAKIISRLISLWTWLSADPNITDLLQREHP